MQLKINRSTKFEEISPFLDFLTEKQLKDVVSGFKFDYGKLLIADFCDIIELATDKNKLQEELIRRSSTGLSVDFFYWIIGFPLFIEFIFKEIQKFEPKHEAKEEQAAAVLPKLSPTENTLIFLRDYFKIQNFSDVEKLTVNDYLLAKKASGTSSMYERNLTNLYKIGNKHHG